MSESDPFPRCHVVSSAAPKSGFSTTRESVGGVGRVFRGFSPIRKSVLRSAGFNRRMEPILSWVSSLQGVLPSCLDTTNAASPLMRFVVACRNRPFTGASGFQWARRLACLSRDCRPSWISCPLSGDRQPKPAGQMSDAMSTFLPDLLRYLSGGTSNFTYGTITLCGRPCTDRSVIAVLCNSHVRDPTTPQRKTFAVWADSSSLAATTEIEFSFCSRGYLDVSVHRITHVRL
jgi:hypothetical protein